MLYLRQSTQGAHNPWGGYSFTWCDTELTVTGRTPSGRLPLRCTQSARRLLLTMRICLTDTGRSPSGRLPLRRTQSLRRLLLSMRICITTHGHRAHNPQAGYHLGAHNPWGGRSSVLHGGRPWGQACVVNKQRWVLTFTTDNRPKTSSPGPLLLI